MANALADKTLGVDYLDFSRVTIDFDKPQIIWAPNGVGKTSLYKGLQQGQLPSASFTEFNDNRPAFVAGAKDTIRIGAHVKELDELQEQRGRLLAGCSIQGNLKDVGLTSVAKIKDALPGHPGCKKDLAGDLCAYDADVAARLCRAVPQEDASFFVKSWSKLTAVESLKDDVEYLKARMLDEITSHLLRWIDEDDTVCPVCGSRNAEPIAKVIKGKKEELNTKEDELVSEYAETHTEKSAEEIQRSLRNLREAARLGEVDEDAVFSFALCGGCEECVAQLRDAKERLIDLDQRIAAFEKTKRRFYENLRKRRGEIIDLLQVKFELKPSDIKFDDETEELVVKLPRDLGSFSTGEVDLMVALVSINEFRASDSDVLVLDDPITSFDMSNQYTVLFDLVSMVGESKDSSFPKSVVLLTHNTNCINIAESQRPGLFRYFSLDRWNDGLRLNAIELTRDSTHRYLCHEAILTSSEKAGVGSAAGTLAKKRAYIKAVADREQGANNLHAVFHYDGPSGDMPYDGQLLSNDALVTLIDSTDPGDLIAKDDFLDACLDKEIALIALRVWVERQFYGYMNSSDSAYSSKTAGKSISVKIDYIFPRKGASGWSGPSNVTRSYLMGKKVMLNQASHENAQRVPFEYALGLSAYEIQKTIKDVKNHFEAKPAEAVED